MENHHLEALPKQDKNQVQRNRKSDKRNTNFKTVSTKQHNRGQSKKHADDLHIGRPGHKQHRNNKCTYLYLTNNGDTIGMPKKYNKKQLDTDAKNFFHLIKLRAHFKDINPKSNRKFIY